MRVRVLFFGVLKNMVGKSEEVIELSEGASVRDLIVCYESKIPQLKESLPSLALAVNQQYVGPETKLKPGDEMALLPPVSGGAPEVSGERRYASIVTEAIETPKDSCRHQARGGWCGRGF